MILYLEKRGCDFFQGDAITKYSDIGNYRVTTTGYNLKGKDGINYFIEFTSCQKRRFKNKRTGKPLKKFIVEHDHKLHVSISHQDDRGTWGAVKLDEIIYNMELDYTIKDILTAVNLISADTYTEIKFI